MGSLTILIMLVVFFAVVNRGGRRWKRWGYGPNQFPMQGGNRWAPQNVAAPPRAELESYGESLESRIAQLEERLDFTERLLTGSKDRVDWKAQPVSRETDDASEGDERVRGDA